VVLETANEEERGRWFGDVIDEYRGEDPAAASGWWTDLR